MSLASKQIYQFDEFELRVSARILARDGKPIPLGSKAFEVLTCLVLHAGEVVTKDQLLSTVWPQSFVEENNLTQHIFALRKALGDRSHFIVTIPGRGYQFTGVVREVDPDAPPLRNEVPDEGPGALIIHHVRERAHVLPEDSLLAPVPLTQRLADQKPEARFARWAIAALVTVAALAGWAVWLWIRP